MMMKKLFVPLLALTTAMFAYAPIMIANAPYESTMGLVQKIFYFHVPSWFAMFTAVFLCGIESAIFLFGKKPSADRVAAAAGEVAVLFGLMGLVTGPLWGRKSWGIWWPWDARVTMALLVELTFIAYLLVRKFAGPGSEKLAAAVAIFGMFNVPFVYMSVNIWRTIHPKTSVVPSLPGGMPGPFWFSVVAFLSLCALLITARTHLETQRAALDALYLDEE
jgi:heme exporter protein C